MKLAVGEIPAKAGLNGVGLIQELTLNFGEITLETATPHLSVYEERRPADLPHDGLKCPAVPRSAAYHAHPARSKFYFSCTILEKLFSASTDLTIAPINHAPVHRKPPPAAVCMIQVS